MKPCPICGNIECNVKEEVRNQGKIHYTGKDIYYEGKCICCGSVYIQADLVKEYVNGEKRHLLLGYLRNMSLNQKDSDDFPIVKDETILKSMINEPRTPIEKANLFILYLFNKQKSYSDCIEIQPDRDYPITFSKDDKEFVYLLRYLDDENFIETRLTGNSIFIDAHSQDSNGANEGYLFRDDHIRLTMKGWQYAEELISKQPDSKQAFVAMKFDDEDVYKTIFNNAIEPALEKCGFKPFLVADVEHNDSITDVIIAGIRKSGLMVADVTGASQNVYYEAGFAHGLGIPVILCCHKDRANNDMKFDTRQFNHILWKDEADFKAQLIKRIEASGLSKKL